MKNKILAVIAIACAIVVSGTAFGLAQRPYAQAQRPYTQAQAGTHAPHTLPALPAWLRWAPAPGTARADCHDGPAVIVWVAGHPRRGVTACEKNEIIWPGAPARTRSAQTPPAWLHWTRAPANSDCRSGPAEILWIGNSDQSAKACYGNGVILPS